MTICHACKRIVKIGVQCICALVLEVGMIHHGGPHPHVDLYRPAQVRLVDYMALSTGAPAKSVRRPPRRLARRSVGALSGQGLSRPIDMARTYA